MTAQCTLRSPVPWMGGKYYTASFILKAFPPKTSYDLYCEPFMGGCHVIARKPAWNHYEIVNDLNGDLVNFWMHVRDDAEALASQLDTLPYSRELHYTYYQSLFDGTSLKPLERAVRWYYVLQSSFSSQVTSTSSAGWKNGPRSPGHGVPHSYRAALHLFTMLSQRFRFVEIDHRDFEAVIKQHQGPRTLFYIDPPYLGVQDYYRSMETRFTFKDHERLATLLNASPALIALSYYPHPLLDSLYPAPQWRRITWEVTKHSQRTKGQREKATEMLLCNYPELTAAPSLWTGEEILSARTSRRF